MVVDVEVLVGSNDGAGTGGKRGELKEMEFLEGRWSGSSDKRVT